MSSVTVLEDDNHAPQEVPIRKGKGKAASVVMSSEQRRKLADISNLNTEETHQQQNLLSSSKDYPEKLQKENMTLMKALAHRNKIIELSGVEFQKLKINLRKVQENNMHLAQANTHMLAELNTNRDRLKLLQHELGCKNVLLGVRKKMQLEEQEPPCTHHPSKHKGVDMNQKYTKRKRTSRIKGYLFFFLFTASETLLAYLSYILSFSASESSIVKENANTKRKVSGVRDTTVIPELTCQTEGDIEKGVVSQGANQNVGNTINKKFVLDAANPVKASVRSKRQCLRRTSARFAVQETEQTETLIVMDNAKETKEIARLSLRRRSARLRPEEAEPCKSFHVRGEVRKTTKRRRVSSRQQSSMFDFQEPEVTETLNADDAGNLVSEGSSSEAVEEPSESRHDTKNTNGKRRVSTRMQSTKGKSQTASDTNGAIKDIVTECDLLPSTASQGDLERESKNKSRAEEAEGIMRRTSVARRPSRHAAEKVQSYREVSLKVKMRRNF
ncbi:SHUGOSHIN 2 isoform X1 [Brassica rapa]|uniref:SHUGOSHIN 2 isoform X1 n=1 Tax=Brassica campestris TaxID=3711 RepID=UPI00142E8495|nr:SHUGOSHIN 2 isoform X1 [Brassica rapa]